MTSDPAILAEGIRKRYRDTDALDGFDLAVAPGTVCGLLGPNGAGKTSAVKILSTLVRADSGHASVAGFDVARQPDQVRSHIGLVGQHAAVDEVLSARQNLIMFGRLYHLDASRSRERAHALLTRFGLADTGTKPVAQFSGGMRRRLDLAASMILSPPVLFLDEPTTGLDPRSRNDVWEAVRALVTDGTTVLLTTQYLEEADQLAGHIAVVADGRVITTGTPDELKSTLGGDRIDVVVHQTDDLPAAAAVLAEVTGSPVERDEPNRRVSAPVRDRVSALTQVAARLTRADIRAEDIGLRRPTLDEVFLHMTEEVAA